jgi:hypothetical protein
MSVLHPGVTGAGMVAVVANLYHGWLPRSHKLFVVS